MLKVSGITKRFGGLTAVNNVSIEVEKGQIMGLIGPNGAGKTTLFNILTGIYTLDSGEIIFEGQKISGLKPFKIANAGMTRTFQNIRLLKDDTVTENVTVGLFGKTRSGLWQSILGFKSVKLEEDYVREESRKVIELVGLKGYENETAGNLSYGNQRRIEIARAIISMPKLLLLDEPTAGMNAEETEEMMKLIRTIRSNGTTIILIEHNVGMVIGLCDRVAVLDHGEKIADDKPDEVIASPAVIEAYIGKAQEEGDDADA